MSKRALKKILLVEDEPDIRTIAKIALEDVGQFTLQCCASGKEALSCVEGFQPDLILLDVIMPEMNGMVTFQELRKKPALKETPIIFMTARVQENEVAEYYALGALDVISKPFNPMTLAQTLHQIWDKSHG